MIHCQCEIEKKICVSSNVVQFNMFDTIENDFLMRKTCTNLENEEDWFLNTLMRYLMTLVFCFEFWAYITSSRCLDTVFNRIAGENLM